VSGDEEEENEDLSHTGAS